MVRRSAAIFFTSLWCFAQGAAAQYSNCTNGTLETIGDGQCNAENNNPSCGFDGGDCCPCTCSDGPLHSCINSSFNNCEYPECASLTTSGEAHCIEDFHGDGFCDPDDNNPSCGFDGGDCCECSCVDGPNYSCGFNGYSCLDPACLFDPELIAEFPGCDGDWLLVGDGSCLAAKNNALCGYDGGDCCECSCIDGPYYSCGLNGYSCLDPACLFNPELIAEYPDCDGDWLLVGDGHCLASKNNALCGYDGGDCCQCTCSGIECADSFFDCLDPSAYDELYECEEPPPEPASCSANSQGGWVVENTAQATSLSAALNCSGGLFEVEWRGSVEVSQTFYVAGGTTLLITGAGSDAAIDGGGRIRLFTVTNATLHLNGVSLASGASLAGGAIAAAGSSLVLNQTSFFGHRAAATGGAVFVSGGSSVSCGEDVMFSNNEADVEGGAMYVAGNSAISCAAAWANNTAAGRGGALSVHDASSVIWSDESTFVNNSAGTYGGALYAFNGTSVFWSGTTTFFANHAGMYGGAVETFDGVSLSWNATTGFYSNIAGFGGGAVLLSYRSNISWSGAVTFSSNSAASFGGAVAIATGSRITCSPGTVTTFSNNSAGTDGGAVLLDDSSDASFDGNTLFDGNVALGDANFNSDLGDADDGGFGGALCLRNSTASWSGMTMFSRNTAGYGGGLFASNGTVTWDGETTWAQNNAASQGGALAALSSTVSWGGSTAYLNNSADSNVAFAAGAEDSSGSGGAIAAMSADISWSGNSTAFSSNHAAEGGGAIVAYAGSAVLMFNRANFDGNRASSYGGAVYVSHGSSMSCVEGGTFANNKAGSDGGAVFVTGASAVSCGGSWLNNTASDSGGAIGVQGGSAVSWGNESTFVNNTAENYGGAVYVSDGSSLSWDSSTDFHSNRAGFAGGAVALVSNSSVWSSGTTTYTKNIAELGGGLLIASLSSEVSWSGGSTLFANNSAQKVGGAIFASRGSVTWSAGVTRFEGNSGLSGGAIHLMNGSVISWTADTEFVSNEARADGGAIGPHALDSLYNPQDSTLIINGATTFTKNACGANGGALAMVEGLSVVINSSYVAFTENSASVAGGAVFMSGIGVGPVFADVSFIANSAEVGGAVSMLGSGKSKSFDDLESPDPTTFHGCRFMDNRASTTGGAIETAAGEEVFADCVFGGNTARVGGAMRLAGTASVINSSFVEKVSADGEGSAISNIGLITSVKNTSFHGNVFDCGAGMFVDFEVSRDPFETVCSGCETTCDGCAFDDLVLVPTCEEAMEHSNSSGGTGTVEMLVIESGYWRATSSSPHVLECYYGPACLGGVTGTAGYCLEGYEGPYCAVCSDGYTPQLGVTCSKCADEAGGIVLVATVFLVALVVAATVVSYVLSGDGGGRMSGVVTRVAHFIPLQSVKIVIVVWQILTQFTSVAHVSYPGVYQRFLDSLEVVNFDLGWILSAGCIFDIDFHDRLLISTIGPICILLFLLGVYAYAARINRGSNETLQRAWHKHVSLMLLLTFLVYSSVSAVLFKMFACEKLDDGGNYLRADYRITCDSSKHRALQVYAGGMMLLYTVGIPVMYACLLFRDSDVLKRDRPERERLARISPTSELWRPYKPSVFYYEVVECSRRVLLSGAVVFIRPNTAAQIAVTLMMAFVFVVISEGLAPYVSRWDTWLSRIGHAIVFVSMYVALLLKVDVSDEGASSQHTFEALLVAAHVCMMLVILLEAVVQALLLWTHRREETGGSAVVDQLWRGCAVCPDQASSADNVDEVERQGGVHPSRRPSHPAVQDGSRIPTRSRQAASSSDVDSAKTSLFC
ncbi:unnamed protein product [Scytosiphon promiscuus]